MGLYHQGEKAGLKYATIMSLGQSVMIIGMFLKLELSVDNWDSMEMVSYQHFVQQQE